MTRELTDEEQQAITSLTVLAKSWPQSLMLFSGGSQLYVFRLDDRDALMADWNRNADLVLAVINGIPNDGGDP